MTEQILAGHYQIIQPLAAGGMGQTFIAKDTHLPGQPQCVVKRLHAAKADSDFLTTIKRLFFSEAETLQKLGKHSQIPQLLAYFEQSAEFYLVQEFIEGHPLTQELPLGQCWSEPQVIQLMEEILNILTFVHDQKVIHRDIKPDNILRRQQDNQLVLIDFGAVKEVRAQQTVISGQVSQTVAIGTPGYMPTEQTRGKPRFSSDLYAVGIIGIQALTGLSPAQLPEDDEGELVWIGQADVSSGFAQFLTKMVRYHFKERYQTAGEAIQALQQAKSTVVNPSTPIRDTPPIPPTPQTSDTLATTEYVVPTPMTSQPAAPVSNQAEVKPSKNWLVPVIAGTSVIAASIMGAAMILKPPVQEVNPIISTNAAEQDAEDEAAAPADSFNDPDEEAISAAPLSHDTPPSPTITKTVNVANSNNDEIQTYTAGVLKITGTRQHACNVLLPRGPGIGSDFFYSDEAALWQQLQCQELYCNLDNPRCRISLKPQWAKPDVQDLGSTPPPARQPEISIVDQVIQNPNQPIPAYSANIASLSQSQFLALNQLFNQFQSVNPGIEPISPGSSTTFSGWKLLCIGEQSTDGCPKSAKHEMLSYGNSNSNSQFLTSRGWVMYRP